MYCFVSLWHRDGCLNFIDENDEVLISGFGRRGHAVPPSVCKLIAEAFVHFVSFWKSNILGEQKWGKDGKGTSSPFCQVGDIPGVRFKVVKASLYLFSWYIFKGAKCHTFVLDFVFYFPWIILVKLVILREQRSCRWQDVAWVPCTGTRRTLYGLVNLTQTCPPCAAWIHWPASLMPDIVSGEAPFVNVAWHEWEVRLQSRSRHLCDSCSEKVAF